MKAYKYKKSSVESGFVYRGLQRENLRELEVQIECIGIDLTLVFLLEVVSLDKSGH